MNKCIKCGISENKALLFDAISKKGVVKICRKCSFEENMPLIKKLKFSDYPEEKISLKKKQTVYGRLSNLSGIKTQKVFHSENKDLLKQEEDLKKIADKNFTFKKISEKIKNNLVDNFHWRIMRARRLKHLTQAQFAEAIAEPEIAIKEIEQGIVRENYFALIRKIENYLKIKIMKKEILIKETSTELNFDKITTMTLKISDLKKMKQEREAEIFSNSSENQNEISEKFPEENYVPDKKIENKNNPLEFEEKDKKDLSKDEMNDLIFRKK